MTEEELVALGYLEPEQTDVEYAGLTLEGNSYEAD